MGSNQPVKMKNCNESTQKNPKSQKSKYAAYLMGNKKNLQVTQ